MSLSAGLPPYDTHQANDENLRQADRQVVEPVYQALTLRPDDLGPVCRRRPGKLLAQQIERYDGVDPEGDSDKAEEDDGAKRRGDEERAHHGRGEAQLRGGP